MPLLPAVVLLGVAPASCVCSEVRANGARAVATAVCVASAALLGVARTEGISLGLDSGLAALSTFTFFVAHFPNF